MKRLLSALALGAILLATSCSKTNSSTEDKTVDTTVVQAKATSGNSITVAEANVMISEFHTLFPDRPTSILVPDAVIAPTTPGGHTTLHLGIWQGQITVIVVRWDANYHITSIDEHFNIGCHTCNCCIEYNFTGTADLLPTE